jgi:hypothetical protein
MEAHQDDGSARASASRRFDGIVLAASGGGRRLQKREYLNAFMLQRGAATRAVQLAHEGRNVATRAQAPDCEIFAISTSPVFCRLWIMN